MASDFEKSIITNIDLDSLLEAIVERNDVDKIVKMMRDNKEYTAREYMTSRQFAEYLSCTEKYARELAGKAELNDWFEVARIGREIRIDRISYEHWRRLEQLRKSI